MKSIHAGVTKEKGATVPGLPSAEEETTVVNDVSLTVAADPPNATYSACDCNTDACIGGPGSEAPQSTTVSSMPGSTSG